MIFSPSPKRQKPFNMKAKLIALIAFLLSFAAVKANALTATCNTDSAVIMRIMHDAAKQPQSNNLILFIARKLIGTPYVAKTLDRNTKETLVVNIKELDCTTYVENVLAIYQCVKQAKTSFNDYQHFLRMIRYANGEVSYVNRQHYFTQWIEENTRKGFVKETQSSVYPFTVVQNINVNYMTTHRDQYPMLANDTALTNGIRKAEKAISGRTYRYIPKKAIANNRTFRNAIHDGDILAIVTKKNGLDTSHIGIAVWHSDGLHLLNASMIHKKVVEEPMTLYQYMQKHPSQTGIRIIRIL